MEIKNIYDINNLRVYIAIITQLYTEIEIK